MQTGAPILARLESGIYQIQCRLDDLEWKVDALNRKLDLILEEFAVRTYVADPPSSPSVGNTGWSGPAWIEETFGGSAGGGLNAIGADHNPRIAPNDTLLQPGTLYLGQLNSMGLSNDYHPPLPPTSTTSPASMVFIDGMWTDPPPNPAPRSQATPNNGSWGHGVWADGLGQGSESSTTLAATEPERAEDDV